METSKEAKEKAVELVNRFQVELSDSILMEEQQFVVAKQCAIICVDEIMQDNQSWVTMQFWQQVKHEIQQL